MDDPELADSIIEKCPVYQDKGNLCKGYYEGELCSRSCRYLDEAIDILLEPARERQKVIHGYEL